MDFNHTDDRRMLADSLSRYLREQYSHEHRMQSCEVEPGYSRQSFQQLCDLGIAGALLPESCGGFGGSGFDTAVVFEEFGRGLVVEPFLSSIVLCGTVLAECGTRTGLVGDLLEGKATAALASYENGERYSINRVTTTATRESNGWRLEGKKTQVLNGGNADYLIISARTAGALDSESGITLFLLKADTSGVSINGYPTVDGYRSAEVELSGVTISDSSILGTAGEGYAILEKAIAHGVVALCAESVGAMEVCKEMTVDYLQTRKQFGVPIGKFQVLQHRMVDALIEIEQARSATINAAGHLHAERTIREKNIAAAKNLIGRAARLVAEESIQLHGGIAMTWEYALAHYAKRLVMIDHLLGDTDYHLQRFMRFSATG